MRSPTKDLFMHFTIYGAADLFNKALAVLLIPIYTRHLIPADYGVLQIFVISSNFIMVIMQMGLGSAVFKSILHHENADKRSILNTAFYFIAFSSAVVIGLAWFKLPYLSQLLLGSKAYTNLFRILLVSLFVNSFSVIPLAKFRIENRSKSFSLLVIFRFLLQLILNIIFVVFLKKGVAGILIAELIVAGIFSIIYIVSMSDILGLCFSWRDLKELLIFGAPLVPATLSFYILTMSDRYILKYLSGLEQVGLYSLGYRFGMIIEIIVGAFQKAWPAMMFRIAGLEDAKDIFARNSAYFMLLLVFPGLMISIFAHEIISLFTSTIYHESYRVIPLVALAFVFNGVYYYSAIGINLKRKTIYQPLVVFIAAALNIGMNFLFIPKWGMMGAAFSTVISFIIMAFLANKISQHYYKVPYPYGKIFLLMGSAIGIYGLSQISIIPPGWYLILWKIGLIVLYIGVLFVFGFFTGEEKKKTKEMVSILLDRGFGKNR